MHRITLAILAVLLTIAPVHARGVSTKCLPGSLRAALAHVAATYGRVAVVSAHRPGARIAGTRKRSKHADCKAVDFHVRGNRTGALAWLRKQPLEIITYGGAMHHIHIAIGRYRGHHVVSKSGRRVGGRGHKARATRTPVTQSNGGWRLWP